MSRPPRSFLLTSALGRPLPALGPSRWLVLLGLVAGTRLLILAVAQVALRGVAKGPNYEPAGSSLEQFRVWDSDWYLGVVDEGYGFDPAAPGQSNTGFFPLYPLVVRLVNGAFGSHDSFLAGLLVSNLALVAACVLLWKLSAAELRSPEAADRAVVLLLLWPGSFWFSMVYTESLFLALLLLALVLCRQRRWFGAALAGFALGLTRSPGVLVAAFFAVELLAEWRERHRAAADGVAFTRLRSATLDSAGGGGVVSAFLVRLLALVAPVLGWGSFLVFLRWRFGDWSVQRRTLAAGWPDTALHNPWTFFGEQWTTLTAFHRAVGFSLLGLAALGVAASLPATRRLAYPALGSAFLVLYLSSASYTHFPRYLAVVPPLFLAGAWVAERSRLWETCLVASSAALLALLTALLVCGYVVN